MHVPDFSWCNALYTYQTYIMTTLTQLYINKVLHVFMLLQHVWVAVHPGKVLNYVTYDIITCTMSAIINTGVNRSNTFPGEYFNPVVATTKTIRKTVICRTYNVVVFTYSASRHLRNV